MAKDEFMEVTIVLGETRLKAMLNELNEAKKTGQESVIVEVGAINFQIYVEKSVKLMEINAKETATGD